MATKYKKWAKKRVHYRGLSHHSSQTSKKQWGQNFELCRGHLGGKTDSVGGHLRGKLTKMSLKSAKQSIFRHASKKRTHDGAENSQN